MFYGKSALVASLFLAVVALPEASRAEPVPSGDLQNECGAFQTPVPYRFCVSHTPGSANPDVLYAFHGGGGNEREWFEDARLLKIRQLWKARGFEAPTVISVSFGHMWLLTPRNGAPRSGLEDAFVRFIAPFLEKTYVHHPIRARMLLGLSMGSYNSSLLLMRYPRVFKGAALLCPAMVPLSPYTSSPEDIAAFARRNGADVANLNSLMTFVRAFYPDEASWQSDSPLPLAAQALGPMSPRLYVSTGKLDETYGEGGRIFARIAATRHAPVRAEEVAGGHCDLDQAAVADFIQSL